MPQKAINWNDYAEVYDLMAEKNPAYQELLRIFEEKIAALSLPDGGMILELGSGTGNFTMIYSRHFHTASLFCVEPDEVMNRKAREKCDRLGLQNITIQQESAEHCHFPADPLSACVMMHALYTFEQPEVMLSKVFHQLQPGGYLIICDIGRPINVREWTIYGIKASLKKDGLFKTIYNLYKIRSGLKFNKQAEQSHRQERYWQHSHEEFCEAITKCGFRLIEHFVTYRGCSDFVIGLKP